MVNRIRLSRELSRDVDRRASEEFGLSSLVLMENAGRGLADTLIQQGISGSVAIACGKGNNAGDGFVLARHLESRGHQVKVMLWDDPHELQGDAATNFHILQKASTPIENLVDDADHSKSKSILDSSAWIVDALLGTGAKGDPRPPYDRVIELINGSAKPVLAADIPSGLECDSGKPSQFCIRARLTATFVAEKKGFAAPLARDFLGEVRVLDIGLPKKLYDEMSTASLASSAVH